MVLFAAMASSTTGTIALPRISVVTVVRNGARTVRDTLASVARQRYLGLEYLVIDGASTDGTQEIVKQFPAAVTRWVSEPDGGIYDAMNKGASLATGDFLLFLGADDQLLADLNEVAPLLRDARTVYYGDAFWPGRQRRYDGRFGAAKLALRNICQQAIFYPRAVFEKYRFDARYRYQADWVLNMRCFSDRGLRFAYVPVLVSRYNDIDGGSTRYRDRALEEDYLRLLWRHFPGHVALPISMLVLGGRALRRVGLSRNAA